MQVTDMIQPPASQDGADPSREERYGEFVSLLARYDQSIRRFVRSLLPTREGVDDVMQETALECWKKFEDFHSTSSDESSEEFIRWACVIARYKAMSWQRDRKRDRLVFRESVIEVLAADALEGIDQQTEERQAIEVCLSHFDDSQRRLLLSVHSPGQSVARIAAESGEKVRRLYSRINTLRKRLLECMQQRIVGGLEHG